MSDVLSTYFGKCRCCLSYGYLKSMWSEYYNVDVVEIYGEMLVQCFALLFERSENESPFEEDKICDSCIVKLRDAYSFKKTILESQEELINQIDEDGNNSVKSEIILEQNEIEDESYIVLDNQSGSNEQSEDVKYKSMDHNAAAETYNIIFQDVEFIEEDNGEPKMAETVPVEISTQPSTEDIPVRKRISTKNLPKDGLYKTCKQYSAEDLQECVEAVFAEKMTSKEASLLYKIPKRTIESKLKKLKIVPVEVSTQPSTKDKPVRKRISTKNPPKDGLYKTCKQYSAEDLQECVEAVFAEKMTSKEASLLYKIPKRTIESKLKKLKIDGNSAVKSEIILEKTENEDDSFILLNNQSESHIQSDDFDNKCKDHNEAAETANVIYHDVEYLEEDNGETKMTETVPVETSTQPPTEDKPVKKRKWPQKLPRNERYKTYKQYSIEDVRMCMEAVSTGKLTAKAASLLYKIPKKTIESKLRKLKTESRVNPNKEKNYNFIQELKIVLSYTNATPYKSFSNRYYCLYCSLDGPVFDNPDELRSHTRTLHVNDRIARIEFVLRPIFSYEIVKLDIANLLCSVCCVIIDNWNEMFKHLRDTHNVNLEQAYNRLIPYTLDDNFNCALCKESFANYTHLDSHMNGHYDNHICPDCGDTFVTSYRMNQHSKIHNRGKFPCRYCTKVFALEKYRLKHVAIMHDRTSKFKCMYCYEILDSKHLRHLHVLDAHSEKISAVTCELCGKVFKWRSYYLCHMKKEHGDRSEEDE